MRVQIICQFGKPVRGLSPYGDALAEALGRIDGLETELVDYKNAYPAFLHPAERGGALGNGKLSWCSTASWRRVARRPADVLHIQHWAQPLASYLWPLARMAKRVGKRVVITVHNPNPHEQPGPFRVCEDSLLRSADVLLVHGDAGRTVLSDRLGAAAAPRIWRIAHGMCLVDKPVVALPADFDRLGLDPRLRYVLLFGNLRGYKGIDVLVDAWQRVSREVGDVQLVIAGRLWSGGESRLGRLGAWLVGTATDAAMLRGRLERAQNRDGIVLRQGFLSDEDIDALIRTSTLAVFPYLHFSGQSGAACRAAAQGRPVLVSRVGALPDLAIDDSWIVNAGDVDGLARCLVNKLTGSTTTRVSGIRQLAAVHEYDWAAVALDHARIYRDIV